MPSLNPFKNMFRGKVQQAQLAQAEDLKQWSLALKNYSNFNLRVFFALYLIDDIYTYDQPMDRISVADAILQSNAFPYMGAKTKKRAMDISIAWAHIVELNRWLALRFYQTDKTKEKAEEGIKTSEQLRQDIEKFKNFAKEEAERQKGYIDQIRGNPDISKTTESYAVKLFEGTENLLQMAFTTITKATTTNAPSLADAEQVRLNLLACQEHTLLPYAKEVYNASFDEKEYQPIITLIQAQTPQGMMGGQMGGGGVKPYYGSNLGFPPEAFAEADEIGKEQLAMISKNKNRGKSTGVEETGQ